MAIKKDRIAKKTKRLRKRGRIQDQYLADQLEMSQIDPMDAALSSEARGGMALEAGAAAGAASVPAAQALAEAGMTGDRQSIAAAGQTLQQGVTDAAAKGAAVAEQANNQAIQGAAEARLAGQQNAMAEQQRRDEKIKSDIAFGLDTAMSVAQLMAPGAYGVVKNIGEKTLTEGTNYKPGSGGVGLGSALTNLFKKK